jgi:hypothetical protein
MEWKDYVLYPQFYHINIFWPIQASFIYSGHIPQKFICMDKCKLFQMLIFVDGWVSLCPEFFLDLNKDKVFDYDCVLLSLWETWQLHINKYLTIDRLWLTMDLSRPKYLYVK